jgi:acyl-CoA thioesterase FadM
MYPWLRLARVTFASAPKRKIDALEPALIRMRAWPNDLDFNLHVNNGRYLTLADLARMDWFKQVGALDFARKEKAFPVIGDAIAKFRRDIRMFQTFEIETRLLAWDQKWSFMQHRFLRAGRAVGVVAIRGLFVGPEGPIAPSVFLRHFGHDEPSPPLPAWTSSFLDSADAMSVQLRAEEQARGVL